jgi:hypothetical protein
MFVDHRRGASNRPKQSKNAPWSRKVPGRVKFTKADVRRLIDAHAEAGKQVLVQATPDGTLVPIPITLRDDEQRPNDDEWKVAS